MTFYALEPRYYPGPLFSYKLANEKIFKHEYRYKCRKVQVYSLISSSKTYHPPLYFTTWSVDLFIRVPFQHHGEHTVLQPFRRVELIIATLPSLSYQVHILPVPESSEAFKVKGHNIEIMSQDCKWKNMIFL